MKKGLRADGGDSAMHSGAEPCLIVEAAAHLRRSARQSAHELEA